MALWCGQLPPGLLLHRHSFPCTQFCLFLPFRFNSVNSFLGADSKVLPRSRWHPLSSASFWLWLPILSVWNSLWAVDTGKWKRVGTFDRESPSSEKEGKGNTVEEERMLEIGEIQELGPNSKNAFWPPAKDKRARKHGAQGCLLLQHPPPIWIFLTGFLLFKVFLFILWEFSTIYLESILSLFSFLPRFFFTSLTTQFHDFFLFLKKKIHKNHSVQCMLPNSYWVWDLSWSVVDIPNVTPLKKTRFPSPKCYQLQIESWLGVGFCIHCPYSLLPSCSVHFFKSSFTATIQCRKRTSSGRGWFPDVEEQLQQRQPP